MPSYLLKISPKESTSASSSARLLGSSGLASASSSAMFRLDIECRVPAASSYTPEEHGHPVLADSTSGSTSSSASPLLVSSVAGGKDMKALASFGEASPEPQSAASSPVFSRSPSELSSGSSAPADGSAKKPASVRSTSKAWSMLADAESALAATSRTPISDELAAAAEAKHLVGFERKIAEKAEMEERAKRDRVAEIVVRSFLSDLAGAGERRLGGPMGTKRGRRIRGNGRDALFAAGA